MKAFILDRYGKNQTLRLGDLPEPTPSPDDVVVEVEAAGLNILDSKIRDGAFKPILPYKPPLVLGHDLAGTVVKVGAKVRRFKSGDAVYARARDGQIGAFAERISVKEADLALKPANLSMSEAASIPLVGLTAWQVLVERAQIRPGQKVLIHAGSGGVGTFAIQLAKHLGATVATTASAANAAMVKQLGADIVIDYRSQNFEEELSGYDLVLNSLDARTLEKSLKILKPGGKLISISGPPDPTFARAQGMNAVLQLVLRLMSAGIRRKAKRAGVDYSFLFMRADGGQLERITKLIEDGTIRPVVDRSFPFETLNEAFAYIDTGRAKGKVVVTMK
ncbi:MULTISPECIES: NADP-dependent oxidoreductase [Mesorhizobium]|jgi:NADPH:quinone reductase-like Zn-dependent oxidoreductase|uniref:NADPH:quinone oxidoreductase n=1 Tax=Rhizobium loti TaxID=381 RepID=A0A6M7TX54_RHILI|nr:MULTISPECIES: NADP-dependent oxidoreductase [Mesorhizobium]KRB20640.1 NADPH:quinone oxidoreductase [Mesorhizobium sp. Root172]OBQ65344.1 NADPH:quinone oxidoreductase [Mesorhizobium loti]QKC68463.1 NADP-dependent oxidoreductase [Mesorhizobium loti]QKC87766.1 NADP-dependent oxidoreductase [Mesorhizobium sp. NZP2234]